MGQYDFSYELPANFSNRVLQLLQQTSANNHLPVAFQHCKFEYDDLGLAYYVGIKGDNWDKHAVHFIFEGSKHDIDILRDEKTILKDALQKGIRQSVSGFIVKDIVFLVYKENALPSDDEERLNTDFVSANDVLSDLIKIGEKISSSATYTKETSENRINDFVRDALLLMDYNEAKDQTRHGISPTGKDSGEVDILITRKGKEIAIIEGIKLNSVDSGYIDGHIKKAVIDYNTLGTATFLVAYVSSKDFESFWNRYTAFLREHKYPLQIKRTFETKASPNAAIRVASIVLSRDGYDFPLFFLAINLN